MPDEIALKPIVREKASPPRVKGASPFPGFHPPTSNTTYTPNQFFDVVIPHFSRGVVRIVAYLIRKTLGWCDRNGNPQEELIEVSYSEIQGRAGVSRGMIREALDDAIKGRLIECVRQGRPKMTNDPGQSALYSLRWSDSAYTTKPEAFQGFFEGEGNRTDIPNEFFDVVIPREPLSVIKVVGSIIRHSIGFQTKHGRRRQQVALSYQHIQNYARFGGRSELAKAIRTAQERHYILRLENGVFRPYGDERRRATYALRWSDNLIGQKSRPADHQSAIQTSIGQKIGPADQSEKQTSIKTKPENKTLNEQPSAAHPDLFKRLLGIGFTERVASNLITNHGSRAVEQQIEWLSHRAPAKSPAGLLRKAIEENWSVPKKLRSTGVFANEEGGRFASHFYAAFGGNSGEPANEPSSQDSQAASAFVSRLLEINPDAGQIPIWGRAFGTLARDEGTPFPSLQLALRQFADRFLVSIQQQAVVRKRAESQTARATHENRFRPAYVDWLAQEERRLESHRPGDYERFAAKRVRQRADLQSDRKPWTTMMLQSFETEQSRLSDLREFFGLPHFWQWDDEINPEPFEPLVDRRTPNPPTP